MSMGRLYYLNISVLRSWAAVEVFQVLGLR